MFKITTQNTKRSVLFLFFIFFYGFSQAQQSRTIRPGSVIINMGVTPQTYANGLKPYGLVYNLLDIQKVPVIWSINPSKLKDGTDFTVDGINFKGGTFIIEKEFAVIPSVQAAISSFVSQGVVIHTTLTQVTIPLYKELQVFPKWVMDTNNGNIAIKYLTNAGIPSSAYKLALPSELTNCDDLFILPHADPTWPLHGRLYSWNNSIANGGNSGWIWAACHAVSVLESVVNPSNPSESLNFLATPLPSPLVNFGSHTSGTTGPYSYSNPTDSPMQFMSTLDAATQNGSEQVYLPKLTGQWRPTTTVSVWDSAHPQIPSLSPGKAAKVAYGYAFGDTSRGKVMYEAGHNHDKLGNNTASVAAQRAMLNFSFDAPVAKAAVITNINSAPATLDSGNSFAFNISAVSPNGNNPLTYAWTSTCGGTFSSTTVVNPTYTAPILLPGGADLNCLITVVVTDSCSRSSFMSFPITIIAPPAPPIANNDLYNTYNTNTILLTPLVNDTDLDNDIVPLSLINTSPLSVPGGIFTLNGDGTITFIPTIGFVGTAILNYRICDATLPVPLCDTATITVTILASPCTSPNLVSSTTDYGSAVTSSTSWTNPTNALGVTDATGSNSTNASGAIVIDLGIGNQAVIGSQIQFRIYSTNGSNVTGTIDASTSTTFPVAPVSVSTTAPLATPQIVTFTVTQANTRYVRITGINRFGLESVSYQKVICVSPSADVAVVKTVNNNTPVVGTNVIFTITASNNGPSIATGVVVNDILPAGYTVVSVTPSGGTWSAPNWSVSSIGSGNSATLTILAKVNASGSYANTATISAIETDPVAGNNTSTSTPVPVFQTDLSVLKDVNNSIPNIGSNITFTLTATNLGASNATGVVVNDLLPSGYTFVSATTSIGTYTSGTGVWTIGNLVNGETATLAIVATVNASGSYANTAAISGNELDPVPGNNTSTNTPVPVNPIFAVNDTYPTQTPGTVNPTTLGNVTSNDTLNGVSVTASNTNVTPITTGPLSIDGDGVLTLAPNTPSGIYTIIYQLCESDPITGITLVPANCDTATATVVVLNPIDAVNDSYGPINGYTGGTTASVLSNDTINGVLVNPSDITLTAVTVPAGLTLNANGTITVASGTAAGTYTVTYTICEVLNPTNCDTANAIITIFPQADLFITKVVNNISPNIGSNVTFTITITNNGLDTATGVIVTDNIPSGYTLVSATPSVGTWTNPTWFVGNLSNGVSATLTVVATVNATGVYSNTATVTGAEADPNLSNNSSTSTPIPVNVIDAINDNYSSSPLNPGVGGSFVIVENDTLNGITLDPLAVNYTIVNNGGVIGASINSSGVLDIPLSILPGTYVLTYTICEINNPNNCDTATVTIVILPCDNIIIHNAFTPNNDGFNEYFSIENIENTICYPTNKVEIYNRWGVLVYETKNYDNSSRRFEGVSEGRVTVNKSAELPTGVYFYIIQWKTSDGQTVTKDGYLYLTR